MTGTVRIQRIAAGGDGVGRLADGRAVFVPRTAPGDLIEPAEVELHARYARAAIGRVLEPGAGRVEPRCAHYRDDVCGGCQLQHLDSAGQRAARRAIVGDALRRLARLSVDDPELEPAEEEWGYRARITLAVEATGGRAGFHRAGSAHVIVPLVRCEIADERLNEAWSRVREGRAWWPPAVSHIVLRVGRDDRVHVVFRGPVKPDAWWSGRDGLVVWWEAPGQSPRPLGASEDAARIPPGVFEQVHAGMGRRVREWALAGLGSVEGQLVWDLYAGIGETSDLLAERGASVESVELDPDAVAVANRTPGGPVRRHAGRVEDWVGRLSTPAAVVTNPPRTGMDESVTRELVSRRPGRVLYISCDPATLARDLGRMAASYQVTSMRSFDLFPQTAHVETVVRLDRT